MPKTINYRKILLLCFYLNTISLVKAQISPIISLSTTAQERWLGAGIQLDSILFKPQVELRVGVLSTFFQSNFYPNLTIQIHPLSFRFLRSFWQITTCLQTDVQSYSISKNSVARFIGLTPQIGLEWGKSNLSTFRFFIAQGLHIEWYNFNHESTKTAHFPQLQVGIKYVF